MLVAAQPGLVRLGRNLDPGYDDAGRQTSVREVKNTSTLVDLKYCYNKVAITSTMACTPASSNSTDTRYWTGFRSGA